MSRNIEDLGLSLFFTLMLFLLGFVAGYEAKKHPGEETLIKTDTIYVEHWDTIKIDRPTEKVRYIVRFDTINTIIVDSIEKAVDITIPIEQAIYHDSCENAQYEAYVSGYKAQLDSININCRQIETIITNTERIPARRISLGVQFGVGISAQGVAAPYAGIGLNYRLW